MFLRNEIQLKNQIDQQSKLIQNLIAKNTKTKAEREMIRQELKKLKVIEKENLDEISEMHKVHSRSLIHFENSKTWKI